METKSYLFEIVLAGIGGLLVVIGLLMEHFGDVEWYEFKCLPEKRSKSVRFIGELLVIIGVGIEVFTAARAANSEWQISQIAKKNNPLLQPVSQISARLVLVVDASTFTPKAFQGLKGTYLNFDTGSITNLSSSQIFSLGASDGRYFVHTDQGANGIIDEARTPRVIAYTVALGFSQPDIPLPTFQFNSLAQTNGWDDFHEITVTNALREIKMVEAYVDFVPTNAIIIRGKATLSVNGFKTDFYFSSNSINRAMSEFNPASKGIFLESAQRQR